MIDLSLNPKNVRVLSVFFIFIFSVFFAMYFADRIPSQDSMITARTKSDDGEHRAVELKPDGRMLVQRINLPVHACQLKFFVYNNTPRLKGSMLCFLISATTSEVYAAFQIPMGAMPSRWQQVALEFNALYRADECMLVVKVSGEEKISMALKVTEPKITWDSIDKMWYGRNTSLSLMSNYSLWHLTVDKYISFRELLYRASQYCVVKGIWLVGALSLFLISFIFFVYAWLRSLNKRFAYAMLACLGIFCLNALLISSTANQARAQANAQLAHSYEANLCRQTIAEQKLLTEKKP